jgi:hypothetical protein
MSTSLAIAHVTSSLINKWNSNKKVALVLLYIKKALDLINHELLCDKLTSYGVRGLSLKWLTSYLSNRTQQTRVNACYSDTKQVKAGVPQGSIVSSLLFILFVNDIFQLNNNNIEIYLYADDTAIIFYANNDVELQNIIDNFFTIYLDWCTTNCIVVNPTKSNYLTLNTFQATITINNTTLEQVRFVKYLGILIDDKLTWKPHVEYITKKCCIRIGMFNRILCKFTSDIALLYYNAFIRSCFEYCIMY